MAQQQPYYTQYVLNPFVYNPALAGIENYWDVKMSYRHQWQGVAGAPRTLYLTVNGPTKNIKYSKNTTSTVGPVAKRRPAVQEYWKKYKSIQSHGGVGMTIYQDQAGPLNLYSASVSYAYHVGLTPRLSIGSGISAGVQGYRLRTDQLDFGTINPDDPVLAANGLRNEIQPELNLGIWLYSSFCFIGAAAQNTVTFSKRAESPNALQTFDGRLVPHYSITAGYKFIVNEEHSLLPSVIIRYVAHVPATADVNVKWQYRDTMWMGMTVRSTKNVAYMMGFYAKGKWSFGYSYDFLSPLNGAQHGSHEVVVGLLLGNKLKVLCPRDFW